MVYSICSMQKLVYSVQYKIYQTSHIQYIVYSLQYIVYNSIHYLTHTIYYILYIANTLYSILHIYIYIYIYSVYFANHTLQETFHNIVACIVYHILSSMSIDYGVYRRSSAQQTAYGTIQTQRRAYRICHMLSCIWFIGFSLQDVEWKYTNISVGCVECISIYTQQ